MSLRVLLVDDSATFLDAARSLLERERLEVVGDACNTAEALQKADELSPDVVLVDVALGRESGLELARRLAASDAGQSIPVILISTRAEEDLADLIAGCPALGFVAKSELSAASIQRVLASARH
jgi:CheY-like chemotaxis protein